jgi:hypothetical protein
VAGTTAVYGLRYQDLGDSPNGATGTHNLADDVEAALAALDAKIATINGLGPVSNGSTSDELSFANTSFAAGATSVGVAFTGPPSGEVLIHFTFQIQVNINGQAAFGSIQVKTGATVGSGTLVGSAANSDRAITVGKAVNASAPAIVQCSRAVRYTGLTPGSSYNVQLLHCVDGGSGSVTYREVIVQPQL